MNPWTEWRYWFKDSILKQTLMLLDKSGLRKGKNPETKKKSSFVSRKKIVYTKEEEVDNAIKIALETGVGYNQYKKEVDSIRAARIRERLENEDKED